MSNEEITDGLLIAYLNKELSNEEMIKVDLWLAKSSQNMEKFNDIRKVWNRTGEVTAKPVVVDMDKAWSNVLSQINTDDQVIPLNPQPKKRMFALVAASLALLVGAGVLVMFMMNQPIEQLQMTADASVVKDVLADGSEVTLNENSVLSYPKKFSADERRVQLTGEAFFDIERDEKKPFIIDLPNESYVKVLGTSFNIDAHEGDSITTVYVHTGKVEFGSDQEQVILTPGQKAIMNNKSGKVRVIAEEHLSHEELFWIDKSLEFDGESLEEVVGILQDVFSETISINCAEMRDEPIKSSHKQETLEEVLDVIAEVHDLKIEKFDGTYVLECND